MDENESLEVDTTSFMNLMVVLIPILLFSMGFKSYFSIDLTFPMKTMVNKDVVDLKKEQNIEIRVLKNNDIEVNLIPGGVYSLIKKNGIGYDVTAYQNVMHELKLSFIDKKDIAIYMHENLSYSRMVELVNASSAYMENDVFYELFPNSSLGIIHE